MHTPIWSIVLAGGDGERTRPFVERWLGRPLPKQYCTFVGTRSLLQHTVDRADAVGPACQRFTVVARAWQQEAAAQLASRGGRTVVQPANRGTAAGVFLPLTWVRAVDPDATVAIYPSDHFVWPEARFAATIRRAVAAVAARPDRPILLGVAPDRAEGEYGWIVPQEPLPGVMSDFGVRPVARFEEKPAPATAGALLAAGGLWNTLVIVARVSTLWEIGWRCCPDVLARFEALGAALERRRPEAALETIYAEMPACDFSADVLQPSAPQLGTIELRDVLWSDWGRPERILETLVGVGRRPAFPIEYALPAAVDTEGPAGVGKTMPSEVLRPTSDVCPVPLRA